MVVIIISCKESPHWSDNINDNDNDTDNDSNNKT